MDLTKVSKTISHALRHAPEEYGLKLDEQGWVGLNDLIAALRNRAWPGLELQHIMDIAEHSEKKRFQIEDGRIRAYYGHSVEEKIVKQKTTPPEILYHGTSKNAVDSIMSTGLKPMDRQYVHLSADTKTAHIVGKRRAGETVILKVLALQAHNNGTNFYEEQNHVWLSDPIPPQFIQQ